MEQLSVRERMNAEGQGFPSCYFAIFADKCLQSVCRDGALSLA